MGCNDFYGFGTQIGLPARPVSITGILLLEDEGRGKATRPGPEMDGPSSWCASEGNSG